MHCFVHNKVKVRYLFNSCTKAIWLRRFFQLLEVMTRDKAVKISSDNMVFLAYVKNKDAKYHGKSKHIDI